MACLVSALSAGPLSTQVDGLGLVCRGAPDSRSAQRDCIRDDDHETILSKAFADASRALHERGTAQADLIWQPIVHHAPKRMSNKRGTAAAGLRQPMREIKKRKTESTPAEIQLCQKKQVGRPRGSFTTQIKPRTGPTHLRINKPVQTTPSIDIWAQIIRSSTLSTVLRLRNVSRDIRALLSNASIWKAVRLGTYGSDHPDPPPGVNERQYADLLEGTGCQSKGCKNTRANWVCWGVQRRWCVRCFRRKTISLEECDIFLKDYPEVVKCIPRLNLRIYTLWKENDRAMTGFLRADLVKIADGFDEMRSKYNTRDVDANADFRAWVDQKVEANDELVEKLQSIQRWANSNYDKSRIEFIRSRRERSDFFAAKALLMEPPLEVHDLFRLSSFRNAIAYRGSLSDKAWESLEKRIRLELTEVERDMSGLLVRCRRRSFSLDSESDEIHTAEGQIHADPQTDQEDCIDSSAIPHVTNGPGAFDGRVATTVDGLTDSGFAQNVLSVAHLLQGSTLEDKYKTQIALAYGVQKHKALVGCSPNQAMFEKLRLALLRNGILGLFEGFRCRACHKLNQKAPAYGHFGRSIKSLAKLGDHYFSKHCPLDWSKDMLDLPSPQELLAQLKMPGQQKAYSTFKQLFPLECDIDLDPQLRDDATEASEVETEGTANNNSLADEQVRSIVEDSPDETDYRAATAYGSNKHNILQTKDPSEDHGFEESENSEEETEDTEYDGDADEEEEEEEEENEREVKGKGKEREKGKGKETQPKKSVQKEKVDERHLPGERILPRRRRNRRSNQSEANRETRKGFRPILPKNSIVLLAGECHFTPRIGGGADWHLVDSPGDTSEREI